MSKRIDELKFGAVIEAISQISPFHGKVLSDTMDIIDIREAKREREHTRKWILNSFILCFIFSIVFRLLFY
jgi:hypothetical protein